MSWWDGPSVDGAVKHLTKALTQLRQVVQYRVDEQSSLYASLDRNKAELDRASRIHDKLTDLLQ